MDNKIKAMLPYVGCKTYDKNNFPKNGILLGICDNIAISSWNEDDREIYDSSDLSHKKCSLKLILRPISSLTDEEKMKLYNVEMGEMKWRLDEDIIWIVDAWIEDLRGLTNQCYQYLQSIHIDLPNYYLDGKTLKEEGLCLYE